MMNKIKAISILLVTFFLAVSCNRNDDGGDNTQTGAKQINNFVWKGLNSWYYWQKDVANLSDNFGNSNQYVNYVNSKNPDDLFYGLLYDYPNTDRFSWIVDDVEALQQQFSGISKDSGMNLSLYYKDTGKVNVVGIINYVVTNSPAAKAGLERGDVIDMVNGAAITASNYQQLFSDNFSVSVAENVSVSSSGVVTSGEKKKVTLVPVVLEENPVAYYQKYDINDKKIGYLVYNGFQSIYNDELNAAFAQMKQDGVKDLVLDLRYNGGGSVESAVALGQMVTGNFTGSPYVIYDFNDKHNKYDDADNLSDKVNTYNFVNGQTQNSGTQVINSLGLNKVYVLTSGGTASASELTIKGLRAYINVVTIGAETYGKFVGSITLYDSPSSDYTSYSGRNTSHKWAMQPIVFSYYNGKKEANPTKGGISPDYAIDSFSYFGTIKQFGNTSDPALAKALELITGTKVSRTTSQKSAFSLYDGFLGTNKTFKKFGTEMYIENFKK